MSLQTSRELAEYSSFDYATAIIPKVSGTISFISSIFVLQDILRNPRKRKSTYHLILSALSFCDILSSFVFMMGTWIMEKDSELFAGGTHSTCAVFGFIDQFANLGSVLYVATLSIYYFLLLKLRWSDARIKKVELFLLGGPFMTAIVIAIAAGIMRMYDSATWLCWISTEHKEYWILFMYLPVWISIFFILVVMILIYRGVRELETKSSRYSFNASGLRINSKKRAKSKRVMRQAFFYVGALIITWLWGSIARMYALIHDEEVKPLFILMTIFLPLQGFLNLMIYFKPKVLCYASKGKKKRIRKTNVLVSPTEPGVDIVAQNFPIPTPSERDDSLSKNLSLNDPNVNTALAEDENVNHEVHDQEMSLGDVFPLNKEEDDDDDDDYLSFNNTGSSFLRTELSLGDNVDIK